MQKNIQFFRYVITGGMTTFVDIFLLYVFVEFFSIPLFFATGFAFLGALIFSFTVNSLWTFADKNSSRTVFQVQKFLKFFFVSLIGLSLTLFLMWVLTEKFGIFYLFAKICTSGVVLFWNFLANSLWTFSSSEKKEMILSALNPEEKNFPLYLSVVIPAYNEEKRIKKTLIAAQKFFDAQNFSYEILVIDDGSSDNTVSISKKNISPEHRIISLQKNSGKGFAVKTGFLEAQGRYILFCDADGATPFSQFTALEKAMGIYHIAIGSRYINEEKGKNKSDQPLYRVFFSRVVNFFAQVFLIDGFLDTQCGFKLFRSEAGKKIFSQQKIFRYAFDVECLVLARKYKYQIAEIPVEWHDQEGSKFSGIQDGIKTFYDFLRIKFYMMFGGYR